MSEENRTIFDIVAAMEQFETQAENTAKVMATYRKSLEMNGIDQQLAEKMTADLNRIFWSSVFSRKAAGNE